VTLCERTPRLPASPSLFTFQFHSLVVSLSERVFVWYILRASGTYKRFTQVQFQMWFKDG